MNTILFPLRGEFVALCDLLKLTGITTSGGEGNLAPGYKRTKGQA